MHALPGTFFETGSTLDKTKGAGGGKFLDIPVAALLADATTANGFVFAYWENPTDDGRIYCECNE